MSTVRERREFEMTDKEHEKIMDACASVAYILGTGGVEPTSQQERANIAWKGLAKKKGFEWDTVESIPAKSDRFFTAMCDPWWEKTERLVIRFDGPPGPESGRFIECERGGASVDAGEWVQDGDDWLLVVVGGAAEGEET